MRPTENIEKRIKNINIVIDAESNKRVFSNILQAFEKSKAKDLSSTGPNIWRIISKSSIVELTAAAVIILAISFFIVHQGPGEQADTTVSKVTKSPAEMQAILSLSIAYRRGGIEAVNRQCQKAIETRGPRPAEITIQQILTEFNGT